MNHKRFSDDVFNELENAVHDQLTAQLLEFVDKDFATIGVSEDGTIVFWSTPAQQIKSDAWMRKRKK